MTKVDEHRAALRALQDWEPYLLDHSGLPGPRANLELIAAVADEGDERRVAIWPRGRTSPRPARHRRARAARGRR